MGMEKSSQMGMDGIYRSLRPSVVLPKDPSQSMIPFLFRNSSAYSDKLALADGDSGETLTFAQFKSKVAKVAHGLLRLGIKKGDVVLIFSPNSIEFPLCFLGIVALGAIASYHRQPSLHDHRAFQARQGLSSQARHHCSFAVGQSQGF
ncbi:hypothetical protein NE237_004203 [Protea cynaroides]|uniref:AMP-dependent synthetase/ligase domain-containing protein n=1 Tax=Protea cynaroides TaxID=273540 RepID=A0A9Q0KIH0_9MAGN|nr:hypothetical protein NE237_004203 [Protea cynaroides]